MNNTKSNEEPLIDSKLLRLFDELYRTQSVSLAAAKLGQSQPNVSIGLAKLRTELDDPLFLRSPEGMQPTHRANQLIGPAREALAALRRLSSIENEFNPRVHIREFRVAMSDASHVTLLPDFLTYLRSNAPNVTLEAVPLNEKTGQKLWDGDIDLAVGLLPDVQKGLGSQTLFPLDWVCLVSRQHPYIKHPFSLSDYSSAEHISVVSGTGYTLLQEALRLNRINRQVKLKLPSFLGLGDLIRSSDLIATVPRNTGAWLAQFGELNLFDCPLPIEGFNVNAYWSERYEADKGVQWLRNTFVRVFSGKTWRNEVSAAD